VVALTFALEDVVTAVHLQLDLDHCLDDAGFILAGDGRWELPTQLADALADLTEACFEMSSAVGTLARDGGLRVGQTAALALRVAAVPDAWRTPPTPLTAAAGALVVNARIQIAVDAVSSAARLLREWVLALAPNRCDDILPAIAVATIRLVVDLADRARGLTERVALRATESSASGYLSSVARRHRQGDH